MQTISETDLILNKDRSVYHLNLKPENISDTILTVGDPSRVFRVSQYFDTIDFEMNRREFITHKGTYKGKKVTVISTGMGTDNVEIFMTELDALVNVDLKTRQVKEKKKKLNIIRIGTSGSLQEDLRLGSHLVSDFGVGLDTLMTFYNLRQTGQENTVTNKLRDYLDFPFKPYCVEGSTMLREKFAFDMVRGNTVTCPGFYGPQGRNVRLDLKYPHLMEDLMYFHEEDFWLTNFEMETAGYYALGRLMGHEMLSLNAIIANRAKNKFSKDPDRVIDSLIRKVLERL
ncbi:nucleoside phosphorylase [Reichenbachiella agariperforans]|uniref:nucleoside phosphorylase n=1 Tax=Reichenbachiella agariperforans TaxID=156994 RepID=UPI001C09CE34|nr:nucleoside phosphorylase [Reichenbachiella agariperforans]MBU2915837.1 nucleoside phosphorylase [Reichenbachiella agariperforans]